MLSIGKSTLFTQSVATLRIISNLKIEERLSSSYILMFEVVKHNILHLLTGTVTQIYTLVN